MYKRKFIENKITDISLEQVKLVDDGEKIILLLVRKEFFNV